MIEGLDSLKEGDNSIFKSMGDSDKSNTAELKLREENMLLRQEILQLKKALFMNNFNESQSPIDKIENLNSITSP